MRSTSWLGRVFIAIGCGCLTFVAVTLVQASSFQQTAAETLERDLTASSSTDRSGPIDGGVVGRLEIPRLHLSILVVEGVDDATLSRAVGHMPGTAFPWDSGNAVLAGHRDTYFRPLKNLREGDRIRLTTARGTFEYRAISTKIVEPNDVSVLAPTSTRSLTLVTCYPFVYVGRAPQRFIIYASEDRDHG